MIILSSLINNNDIVVFKLFSFESNSVVCEGLPVNHPYLIMLSIIDFYKIS